MPGFPYDDYPEPLAASTLDTADGIWFLGFPAMLNLSTSSAVDPATLPVSTCGGLIARCKETTAITDLVGERILPGVPPRAIAVPYIVISQTGSTTQIATGSRVVRVRQDAFRLAITTSGDTAAEDAELIREALEDTFNPVTISLDPILLRTGSIVSAWVEGAQAMPGPGEPDKGGNVVRRLLVDLMTITSRTA